MVRLFGEPLLTKKNFPLSITEGTFFKINKSTYKTKLDKVGNAIIVTYDAY